MDTTIPSRRLERRNSDPDLPPNFDPQACPIIACHWFGLGHVGAHRFEEADDSNLLEREVA